jgi:hypothetical protein
VDLDASSARRLGIAQTIISGIRRDIAEHLVVLSAPADWPAR